MGKTAATSKMSSSAKKRKINTKKPSEEMVAPVANVNKRRRIESDSAKLGKKQGIGKQNKQKLPERRSSRNRENSDNDMSSQSTDRSRSEERQYNNNENVTETSFVKGGQMIKMRVRRDKDDFLPSDPPSENEEDSVDKQILSDGEVPPEEFDNMAEKEIRSRPRTKVVKSPDVENFANMSHKQKQERIKTD